MPESLIIGYGVAFDDAGRVLLLRRRSDQALWPGQWWLPGDITPLSEEPDDTVPRIFQHLLRQRVRAGYAHTVYGDEPSSGRHTVHNAYVVRVEEALDGAPDDESNPFDAMEWWDIPSAVAELPEQQAELLATVIDRLESGWTFEDDTDLDDLFGRPEIEDPNSQNETPAPSPLRLTPRVEALVRLALSAALDTGAALERDLQAARDQGWSPTELERTVELGQQASAGRPPA
ncbi:MAG: NUDIX hydrolase [Chloroflexi bacterium]|nr:NUDIX hydrolase [Chloroflexota bacterium]